MKFYKFRFFTKYIIFMLITIHEEYLTMINFYYILNDEYISPSERSLFFFTYEHFIRKENK